MGMSPERVSSPKGTVKLAPLDLTPIIFSPGIENEQDLKDIKFLLQTYVATTFNTNVMRIALNMQEEKIASLLIAYYQVKIDEEMVLRAIKTG
jgi:hypothetical protein